MVAGTPKRPQEPARRSTTGVVGFYKSTDAGEHWTPVNVPAGPLGAADAACRHASRWRASAAATCPRSPWTRRTRTSIYSATVVMWRSDDGGVHWTAVRGAYGGDDYQKIWINPNNPDIILAVSDQGAVISANRGESWSNWYTQPTAAMYHVTADNDFPYRLCGGQQDSGSACVKSRSDDGMITFHDWHPVSIQEYGIAAPDPRDPDIVFGSSRSDVTRYDRKTGQITNVGPDMGPRGGPVQPQRAHDAAPVVAGGSRPAVLHLERGVEDPRSRTQLDPHQPRPVAPDLGGAGHAPASTPASVTPAPRARSRRCRRRRMDVNVIWAGTDDGNIQVTMDGGANWTERHAARDQAVDAHLQHRGRPLRQAARPTPPPTRCASTT